MDRRDKIRGFFKKAGLVKISKELQYHIDNDISVVENVYRPSSDMYFKILSEAKQVKSIIKLSSNELEILNTDIGDFGLFNGERVPLDFPMPNEEYFKFAAEYKGKDVRLNYPMRSSGPKKYKVYVKNKKGNVIKVNFGDKKGGLKLNIHDPEARKSFVARHKCKSKNDKTKAGYWACRIGRYKHLVGGKKRYHWW